MMLHPIRVYADTSVYGGVFDEEFRRSSTAFFRDVRTGRFRLVVSPLLSREILSAPLPVRELFQEMQAFADVVDVSAESLSLGQAYINAGIVTERSRTDAMHIALASVAQCTLLVSWNFKDIVHFQKIPLYNAVNIIHGFPQVAIHAPTEVVTDEEDV